MDAMLYFNRTPKISLNLEAGELMKKKEQPAPGLNTEFQSLLDKALIGSQMQAVGTAEPLSSNDITSSNIDIVESFVNRLLCNGLDGGLVNESCDENNRSDEEPEDKDLLNDNLLSNSFTGTSINGEDTNNMWLNLSDNTIGRAPASLDDMDSSAITVAQEQQSPLNFGRTMNEENIQPSQRQGAIMDSTIKYGIEDVVGDQYQMTGNVQNVNTARALAKESATDLFNEHLSENQTGLTAEQISGETGKEISLSGYSTVQDTGPQSLNKAGEPYQQIGREILNRLEKKGASEFKLQLEPENLGQIDIKLKWADGKLIIDILAFSTKTQALLTSQVDKLVMSMGLQNVQVEQIQVSQSSNAGIFNQPQQNQSFLMNSGMDFSQGRQQENDSNHGDSTYSEQLPDTKSEHEAYQKRAYDGYQLNYVI